MATKRKTDRSDKLREQVANILFGMDESRLECVLEVMRTCMVISRGMRQLPVVQQHRQSGSMLMN